MRYSIIPYAQGKSLENKIIDTVFKLKEVKERERYVEKETKGKHHLSVFIYSKPSKAEPYYLIQVRENSDCAYAVHFNFYVYPQPFTIKFYDTDKDKAISLNEWRQRLKHKISN